DAIAVTGHPGRAGAALAVIRALGEDARSSRWAPLIEAWTAPASRVDLARALAASGAVRAAIDVSDGLAGDLAQLCAASRAGARRERGGSPADAALAAAADALGVDLDPLRAGPSDDYELLLAVDPVGRETCASIAREAGVPLAWIGT